MFFPSVARPGTLQTLFRTSGGAREARIYSTEPSAAPATDEARIVIIAAGDQMGAIEVDRVSGRMDVMLKPMEGLLKGMGSIAGTTLTGDGKVLIVLDIQELFI